ncbi:small multi-drug export protein [Candidatus Woesearchaeota archaeon]|nr:small multi-drug export protein [Candidatus Woesearchaeota archaeon]
MIDDILYIALLTFVPTLELRASIPYGILATEIHWIWVFVLAVAINFVLGLVLYPMLDIMINIAVRIKIFNKLYNIYLRRTQKRIKSYVDRYGELGIALFIGMPLPGSGTYTGSVAAYALGMRYKRFIIANAIGVLIAGILVTAIVLSGAEFISIFVKYPV